MKVILGSSVFAFLVSLVSVFAAELPVEYYKVARVRVSKIQETGPSPLLFKPAESTDESNDLVQPLAAVDPTTIINLGKELWQLVTNNKAVGKFKPNEVGHALPKGITSAMELANWRGPRAVTYEAVYENALGMDLAKMVYKIYFSFAGAYKGKGRYLTNVAVEAVEVSAILGHTFNASARAYPPMNMGTDKEPVAAMQLVVSWDLDGPANQVQGSASFLVRGDGWLVDLNENEELPPEL